VAKIIIVGREGTNEERAGHYFSFIAKANTDDGFVSLDDWDFVLQHISSGNPEWGGAIKYWKQKGWESKIVGISGGDPTSGRSARGARELDVPFIGGVPDASSIVGLIVDNIPADYSGNAVLLVNMLSGRESLQILPALAILCQGYLAIHAANGEEENDLLKPALNQMGWFDLGDDREKIDESLSKNKEQVKSANWWLAPFGLDGLEMDDSKWNEFEEKFRNEKEDVGEEGWDTVQKFINENIRNGDFKPETIANVYCSLVSMLEGRPCSM